MLSLSLVVVIVTTGPLKIREASGKERFWINNKQAINLWVKSEKDPSWLIHCTKLNSSIRLRVHSAMDYSSELPYILKIADAASEKVLNIYMSDFKVDYKADQSPITAADLASHDVIVQGLRNLSRDIPILSEEGSSVSFDERKHWRRFWLIDPIDGTKRGVHGEHCAYRGR